MITVKMSFIPPTNIDKRDMKETATLIAEWLNEGYTVLVATDRYIIFTKGEPENDKTNP